MAHRPGQTPAGTCPASGLDGTFANQQHQRDYTKATAGDTQQIVDMTETMDDPDNDALDDADQQ